MQAAHWSDILLISTDNSACTTLCLFGCCTHTHSCSDAGRACLAIQNCGTTSNSHCCPSSYASGLNPSLKKPICPEGFFCAYAWGKAGRYAGSARLNHTGTGVCLRNAADCGKLGKPCCIITQSNFGTETCEPGPGKKGYCAAKDGSTKDVKNKDLICQLCPASGCPQASG